MDNLEEEAVITFGNEEGETKQPQEPKEEEEEEEYDEEEYDEEEYIEASRYSFELGKDHFIFDFKDVDPDSDESGAEESNENDENDDNEENEENEEDDGMEEEGNGDDDMTEQQRVSIIKEYHNRNKLKTMQEKQSKRT